MYSGCVSMFVSVLSAVSLLQLFTFYEIATTTTKRTVLSFLSKELIYCYEDI